MTLDGWPDLLVSNDTEPTLVYHNQGDGTFNEVATELGVAVAESGKPKAGMGIDTGDDRNNGTESILITNFAGEQLSLYRKDENGQYLDEAAPVGIGLPASTIWASASFSLMPIWTAGWTFSSPMGTSWMISSCVTPASRTPSRRFCS